MIGYSPIGVTPIGVAMIAAVVANPPVDPPAPTVTSVTVSPATATVPSGTTLQLSAVAAGANNPAQTFTWAVVQGFGDSSASGLYTPPAASTAARTAKVRATSTVDPSKYGEAIITIPAIENPSGAPMTYSPSKARTINATTSSSAPFAAPVAGFWNLANPKKPYGIKDPNATIDIPMNWNLILADIEDTINTAASSVEVGTGATNAGDQIIGGIQTVFVAGGLAGRTPVTFRIVTNSVPPRTFDRTIELQIEDQ